jgi:hypothetical protein
MHKDHLDMVEDAGTHALTRVAAVVDLGRGSVKGGGSDRAMSDLPKVRPCYSFDKEEADNGVNIASYCNDTYWYSILVAPTTSMVSLTIQP